MITPKPLIPSSALASWLQKLRTRVARMRLVSSPDIRVIESSSGTTLMVNKRLGGGAPGASIQCYKITSIANIASNYVAAKTWDGTTLGGTAVNIALPVELWGGTVTAGQLTRTVTVSGVPGVEEVTPAYAVNGIIWADQPTGGTGVTVATVELTWMDTNRDARTYQFPRRVVEVCVNNVTRRMIIRGSAPA